jgi:alpha-tubulin suppressor-like RCC1 family protein
MTIDKTSLLTKLQNILDTNYFVNSSSVEDILFTVLSAKTLDEVSVITVQDVDRLPQLNYYNSPSGMLYFLDNLKIYAISSNNKWLTLDGKLLREDTETSFSLAFSWGSDCCGRLGDGKNIDKSSPSMICSDFSDWCQVSAGCRHSVALRSNGTAWAWGYNTSGRLGDGGGCSGSIREPVSVVGGFTDWCQVSTKADHTLALRSNGTAWAWGAAGSATGYNDTCCRNSPVPVVGGFTDWCQVSAGNCHSLGLRSNGSLWSWGNNNYAQLGINTVGYGTGKSSPVSVVGGFTDWCQVSAGGAHSLGLRSNGTAWAWGCNRDGVLGDGTHSYYFYLEGCGTQYCLRDRSSPVSVIGGFTDWCQVSSGFCHSLGLRCNGSLWAWGRGFQGALGNNSIINRSSPVSVVGGFTDWCQVSAGFSNNLGLRSNGTAWAWGTSYQGQLGNNSTNNSSSPVSIVGGFTTWCQLSAGHQHNLGVVIKC